MSQTETEAQEEALAVLQTGKNTVKALAYFMRMAADRLESGDESMTGISVTIHEEAQEGCRLFTFTMDEAADGHMGITMLNSATDLMNCAADAEKYGMMNDNLEAWILKEIREGRLTIEGLEALLENGLE